MLVTPKDTAITAWTRLASIYAAAAIYAQEEQIYASYVL